MVSTIRYQLSIPEYKVYRYPLHMSFYEFVHNIISNGFFIIIPV
jgi:hypothetical protein